MTKHKKPDREIRTGDTGRGTDTVAARDIRTTDKAESKETAT